VHVVSPGQAFDEPQDRGYHAVFAATIDPTGRRQRYSHRQMRAGDTSGETCDPERKGFRPAPMSAMAWIEALNRSRRPEMANIPARPSSDHARNIRFTAEKRLSARMK
jgi:hypothetical protein